MEKCAVCKQHILPTDRTVISGGKKVHAEVCARFLEERESAVNESGSSFDLEEIELL